MIIIGEKINGFVPKTLAAIDVRDADYIRLIARKQADAGADYLDVCAGTSADVERETMEWLIDLTQSATDTPLCLDSTNPTLLVELLPLAKRPGIVNSISLEEGKCETVFPAVADSDWSIIALTCDNSGIPSQPNKKAAIAEQIIDMAASYGIAPQRLYIDPLVTTLATRQDSLPSFVETIRSIKAMHPDVHFTSGLSNISFGMPCRKAINMQFLALAMNAGMDSAIMDPTSPDMLATLYATAALLDQDEYCMDYIGAFRDGKFGTVQPKKVQS